jgi:hypothetical protein
MTNKKTSGNKDKKQEKSNADFPSHAHVVLNDDIRIYDNEPISHLAKGEVMAYQAVSVGGHSTNLFALVCSKALTPRFLSQQKYKAIANPNLCRLIDSGKVFWPTQNAERYCFVYEDNIGKPVLNPDTEYPAMGWKPESVLSNVVPTMIGLLRDLRNKEVFHGEIWPGNMFDGGAKAGQKINLGECLTTPAGSQIPSLYEPIERGLSNPIGRGMGDIVDDLYSFGASLAVMLRSEDPMQGIADEKIIEYKIEKGSYATLLGTTRLSGSILELLRGLLYDDPKERWSIEDLEAWQDGRRLSPKQSIKRAKANRPISFSGNKYTRPELLAKDLNQDTGETARIIENADLSQWAERAIEDKLVKSKLEQSLDHIKGFEQGGSYNDRATVTVANGLFPECPIRYQGLSFQVQGFGKYLTNTFVEKNKIEPFIDIIKYNFLIPIIREGRYLEKSILMNHYDAARSAISKKSINLGFERCLYIMNPETPCLSPLLDKYYVLDTVDMMNAFEDMCKKSINSTVLFDRHIISFLSAKDKQNIDPYLADLESGNPKDRVLGQLKVLATIQKRLKLSAYPSIANWVSNSLEPVYNCFHDGEKLSVIQKRVKKMVREGDLKNMAFMFDNSSLFDDDVQGFFKAAKRYQDYVDEQNLIEEALKKGSGYGQNTGRQIASVVSMGLSLLIMLLSVYKTFVMG